MNNLFQFSSLYNSKKSVLKYFQSQKIKKSSSADSLTIDSKRSHQHANVTSNTDINTLKQKEIEYLKIEKTRKKSERLTLRDNKACTDDGRPQNDSDTNYEDLSNYHTKKVTIEDFELVKLVGKGSFGKV